MTPLEQALSELPETTASLLATYGFERERFLELARRLQSTDPTEGNRLRGSVEPPRPGDVRPLPDAGSPEYDALCRRGLTELSAGRCALVVMAGGMATRMGGLVKALVPALPGRTFLDLRLAEQRAVARRTGTRPPLWLMASHSTERALRDALAQHDGGARAGVFTQRIALRLTVDGDLYRDADGAPSPYAPGHGDVVEGLQRSGLLEAFVASGGRTLLVTNLDNLGATLDPAILGFHLEHGEAVTSEVVDRLDDDKGGLPVRADGKLMVLEELRWPAGFDPSAIPVFNINSFWFDARRLLELKAPWTYFAAQKRLGDATVIQFERLLNQVVEWLPTRFLHVPRSGPAARFLPVKDAAELARREPEIQRVAAARGLLE